MFIWTFLLRITHTIISQSIADSSWITLYIVIHIVISSSLDTVVTNTTAITYLKKLSWNSVALLIACIPNFQEISQNVCLHFLWFSARKRIPIYGLFTLNSILTVSFSLSSDGYGVVRFLWTKQKCRLRNRRYSVMQQAAQFSSRAAVSVHTITVSVISQTTSLLNYKKLRH